MSGFNDSALITGTYFHETLGSVFQVMHTWGRVSLICILSALAALGEFKKKKILHKCLGCYQIKIIGKTRQISKYRKLMEGYF